MFKQSKKIVMHYVMVYGMCGTLLLLCSAAYLMGSEPLRKKRKTETTTQSLRDYVPDILPTVLLKMVLEYDGRYVPCGMPLPIPRVLSDRVKHMQFNPTGDLLVSAGRENIVQLWDLNTAQQRWSHNKCGLVSALAFSPCNTLLGVAMLSSRTDLYDVVMGKVVRSLHEGDYGWLQALKFSQNGHSIATAGGKGIKIWDARDRKLVRRCNVGHVHAVAWDEQQNRLLFVKERGEVHEQDLRSDHSLKKCTTGSWVDHAAFSNDNSRLLTVPLADNKVHLWDLKTNTVKKTFFTRKAYFSPDSTMLALQHIALQRNVDLYDIAADQVVQTLESPDVVNSIALSASRMAIGNGNEIQLYTKLYGILQ